jgi:hypothetical protein
MSITIFIGEDLYAKLPEDEQETFDWFGRYHPGSVTQLEEAMDEDGNWDDEVFQNLQEYEDFWGGDQSEVSGDVYKKEIGTEGFDDVCERFDSLSEEVQEMESGTQLKFQ